MTVGKREALPCRALVFFKVAKLRSSRTRL